MDADAIADAASEFADTSAAEAASRLEALHDDDAEQLDHPEIDAVRTASEGARNGSAQRRDGHSDSGP